MYTHQNWHTGLGRKKIWFQQTATIAAVAASGFTANTFCHFASAGAALDEVDHIRICIKVITKAILTLQNES